MSKDDPETVNVYMEINVKGLKGRERAKNSLRIEGIENDLTRSITIYGSVILVT